MFDGGTFPSLSFGTVQFHFRGIRFFFFISVPLFMKQYSLLYTASPENPYFLGELILPYLMANGIFTVTNFHRTFTNKFQL